MSSLAFNGFDVLVHLGQNVINRGLELLPSGSTFPIRPRSDVVFTVVPGGTTVQMVYDAFLEIGRPQITLDQSTQRVRVSCSLAPSSQLTFVKTVVPAQASLLTAIVPQIPITGSVVLDCPFGAANVTTSFGGDIVSGRAAVAHAAGVTATFTLVIPSANAAGNVPLANAALDGALLTVSTATIATTLQNAFGTLVGNTIGDLPLTNPVRLNAGALPLQRARDVVPRITSDGAQPVISLGVLSAIDPPAGTPALPAPPAGLLGALGAAVDVSNYWIVHLVCAALEAAHPAMNFTFDPAGPSAEFTGAVVVEGGEAPIKIKRITVTVPEPGKVHIDGHATASGSCWTAQIPFRFDFTMVCDPTTGAVLPQVLEEPVAEPDVDKDWLCVLIGAIVGAVVGFLVGAVIGGFVGGSIAGIPGLIAGGIIGGVAGLVLGAIAANHLIDPLDLDGVSLDSISVLGGLTLPLPVGGAGFLVEVCDFDDLSVQGNVVFVDFAERHRTGEVQYGAGSGFDLDAGVVRPSLDGTADSTADLFFDGNSLLTLPGARIGPVFDSRSDAFFTLSLTDLERFTYMGNAVPLTALGRRSRLGAWVPFAVRTDEGRYAKCRARRNLQGAVRLEYVVYARPAPCLGSVITLETLAQTVIETGTEVCTEVRTERPVEPPIIDVRPIAPPRDVVALARLTDLHDLVDLSAGVLDVVKPPKPVKSCATHTTVEHHLETWLLVDRRQQATMRVLPTGLTAPIKFEWTVFDTVLTGSGTATVDPFEVTFNENSPIITIVADEGVDLVGSIVCRAIDADGRKLRVIRHINSPSRTRTGGCCTHGPAKLTLIDAALQLDRLRVAERVYTAGVKRLRAIASSGQVREVETLTVKEAVGRIGRRGSRKVRKR